MKRISPTLTIAFFFLAACNSAKRPSSANFTTAINQYFATHGQVCISTDTQFPIDLPASQQGDQHGMAAKLTALQHAGLLNVTNTTAVVQSLANSLSLSSHKPEPVEQYIVSGEGRKYLQTVMTDFGKTSGFCYGQKQVDSIIEWTEPVTNGVSTQTDVTYTYKIANLTSWATRPDVQQAFPAIIVSLNAASKTDQQIALQQNNNGWEVPIP